MSLSRTLASLGLLAVPLCAQTTYLVPAKPGTPEASVNGVFEVARSGDEALLSWVLPGGEIRTIEIYRNHSNLAQGRGRVGVARIDTTVFHDRLPDGQTYWYWLKLTRPNGVVVNIGPVATPGAAVWTP